MTSPNPREPQKCCESAADEPMCDCGEHEGRKCGLPMNNSAKEKPLRVEVNEAIQPWWRRLLCAHGPSTREFWRWAGGDQWQCRKCGHIR